MSAAGVQDVPILTSYQVRLRAIGRQLDEQRFRRVSILEVAGGAIAHGLRRMSLVPEGLEFPDSRLHQLINEAKATRGRGVSYAWRTDLLPTGYEDFLRAVGRELDRQVARQVVISELFTFVTVSGLVPDYTPSGHTSFQPFEWVFSAQDIHELLDQAFSRRRHAGFLERRRRARLLALKPAD